MASMYFANMAKGIRADRYCTGAGRGWVPQEFLIEHKVFDEYSVDQVQVSE
jgi:hypothetical protein